MNDVKSAKRVLDILCFFSEEKAPASLARLCAALNFPKSSCLALMETLVAEGYAYQSDGRYYLTGRWLRESEVVAKHDRFAIRCRPTLEHLGDELGETVILAQLAQKKVVYLDVIEAAHVLRFAAFSGQRKPIHAAASGRALLGALPSADARRIAESLDYEKYTAQTPNSAAALLKAVAEERARGWHVNLGEHQADTISIAVPLVLDGAVLALVVGAPVNRLKNRLDKAGAVLQRAAAALMAANKS
jgi:IclR family transcriptional regulator, acetate operon repressor